MSTVISMELTIGGDLSDFGAAEQAAFTDTVASELGCIAPSCIIECRFSAGSVNVESVMTIPNGDGGGGGAAAAAVASVSAAATTLASQPVSALSMSLGVTVVAAAAPIVAVGVAIPMAVAPPPPSPPPLLQPTPSGSTQALSAEFPIGLFVGVAVGGAALMILAISIRERKLRPKSTELPAATSTSSGPTKANIPVPFEQINPESVQV